MNPSLGQLVVRSLQHYGIARPQAFKSWREVAAKINALARPLSS